MENATTTIKDLPGGEFFKTSPTASKVWTKGTYERSIKKYSCINAEDINNERFIKGSQSVFINFEY